MAIQSPDQTKSNLTSLGKCESVWAYLATYNQHYYSLMLTFFVAIFLQKIENILFSVRDIDD